MKNLNKKNLLFCIAALFAALALGLSFTACDMEDNSGNGGGGNGTSPAGQTPGNENEGTAPEEEEDALPPTADVSFNTTGDDTSSTGFDMAAWLEDSTAWNLSVVETPKVYFAVEKEAAQTITVGGGYAAQVTQAASGEAVDGSEAGDTLDVFTVDTSDTMLLFEGGTKTFTLKVEEPEKASKTITVNVQVEPLLTGTAIFSGPIGGALTRVADAKVYTITGSGTNLVIEETDQDISTFFHALKWVDMNAEDNTEYLIRMEQNEQLPKFILLCRQKANVKVRLRGYGQERIIEHDNTSSYYMNTDKTNGGQASGANSQHKGILNIGIQTNQTVANAVTLILEKNITLKGIGSNSSIYDSLIYVWGGSCLIMEEGSKLTGFVDTSIALISLRGPGTTADKPQSRFIMKGGSITGNITKYGYLIEYQGGVSTDTKRFVKTGGSITDNYDPNHNPNNTVTFKGNITVIIENDQDYYLWNN